MVATGLGRFAAGAAVLASLLAACGSNHINLGSPPTTKPASATTSTIDPTADGGQEAAILAAYRGSLADFNQVATTAPLNPNSPQLADHTTGTELNKVTASLVKLANTGELQTGSLSSLRAYVEQYNGTQAVVVSCERDSVATISASTQRVMPGGAATNGTELVNDLIVLQGGTWKDAQSNDVSPNCS